MAEHGHGHSTAAWTAVTILLVGAFRSACAVVVQSWALAIIGIVLVVVGPDRRQGPLDGRPRPGKPDATRAAPPPSAERAGSCPPRRNDDRGPALTAPALWAAAGLLAVGALAARDPHVHGTWGFCVFRSITGLPCPGCGGLRAVNDLAHGHLGAALASNAWVVLSLAGLAGVVGRVGGRPRCAARPRRWASTPYGSRCSGPAASLAFGGAARCSRRSRACSPPRSADPHGTRHPRNRGLVRSMPRARIALGCPACSTTSSTASARTSPTARPARRSTS